MALPTPTLVNALHAVARKIRVSEDYQWGHMGTCNCGFLAQEVAHLSGREIHRRAMQRSGDWSEQLHDYCPSSGLLFDDVIQQLLDFGFSLEDLERLERLSDPVILQSVPPARQPLRFNHKDDVAEYLEAWARDLEWSLMLGHLTDAGSVALTTAT